LGSLVLVVGSAAQAREGDDMGSGGALGEQNAVFVGTQYRQITSMQILEGELTWEIPFTLRVSTGAKVPDSRTRALVMKPEYALVPGKVSWFGVRAMRHRE
jgi:hypothetical protein